MTNVESIKELLMSSGFMLKDSDSICFTFSFDTTKEDYIEFLDTEKLPYSRAFKKKRN